MPSRCSRTKQRMSSRGRSMLGLPQNPSLQLRPREAFLCFFECLSDVAFVDDVAPVEHGSCLVATDFHRDAFGDSGPDHVSDRGAAEVVEESLPDPRLLACTRPRFLEVDDRVAVVVKDERADDGRLVFKGPFVRKVARHKPPRC